MSQFIYQRFSSGEFLTASKLDQLYRNMDLVRRSHAGRQAPYDPHLGTWWLDTESREWSLSIYDGSHWIPIIIIDPFGNYAYIPGDTLRGGLISSGSLTGVYFADHAVTDLIMQDNILQAGNTKMAINAITINKAKPGSIAPVNIDAGAALKANWQLDSVSEDPIAYSLASVSGTSSGVDISMDPYSHAPCVAQTSDKTGELFKIGCRTGTASVATPGFRLTRSSSTSYLVQYRYIATS